jgi:nucleoside-specific outer membrane channel protein Tsx
VTQEKFINELKGMSMLKRFNRMACTLAALSIGAGAAGTALAEENFQLNTISILATNKAEQNAVTGEGSANKKLNEFQFEHFGLNKWGYLYFDLESYNGHGVGALPAYSGYDSSNNQSTAKGHAFDLYGVVIPSVSLTKVTGKSFTFGPISDVSLIARASVDSYYHYRSFGVGPSFNFAVPGFDWFESGIITHNTTVDYSTFNYIGTNQGGNKAMDKNKW